MEPLGASASLPVSRGHFALIREKEKKNHVMCCVWGTPLNAENVGHVAVAAVPQ